MKVATKPAAVGKLAMPDALAASVGRPFPPGRWLDMQRWETPTFTAVYVDHERDQAVTGEWYSEEFHYFDLSLSGRPSDARGCFTEVFKDYQKLGKFFVVPAGYRYRGAGGPGRQKNLYVLLRANRPFVDKQEFGSDLAPVLRGCMNLRSAALHELVLRIHREVREPGVASELLLEGLTTTLLAETIRWLHRLRKADKQRGGLAPWRMRLIKDRVKHGERLPTVNELATLCRLSRRQLARVFREETGQTISDFIRNTTVLRAKIQLCNTDLPISTIAASLGFAKAAVFSTAFRRATGTSPRDYRTAHDAEAISRKNRNTRANSKRITSTGRTTG